MIELVLFSLLGCALGVGSGLVPGLHVNNLIPAVVPLTLLIGDPYSASVMIVSMAVSQAMTGFIPSVFLGAPEADTSLSVLPGHRMLHEGRGYEAIRLTVIGALGSIAVSLAVMSLLSGYFPLMYELSRPYMSYVLLGMAAFMVATEGSLKKSLAAACVFALSGLLGFLAFQSSFVNQQTVLFPALAGLFGLSVLVTSVSQKSSIPPQSGDQRLLVCKMDMIKSIALGSVAGLMVGFLPAVGVSQAAAVFQSIGGLNDARYFLSSVSGIGMANEVFSLNSVALIGNPRSGASVAIQDVLGEVTRSDVLLFVSAIVLSAGIGSAAALFLGKRVPPVLARLNYRWLTLGAIAMLVCMAALLTGPYGLLVLAVSASVGIFCMKSGARLSSCMGVLMVPSLLFFSGLSPSAAGMLGL